jgi:hypothetical protein
MMMSEIECNPDNTEPCVESKLLALHTSTVCLARALVLSGALDREAFNHQLDEARNWLASFDECGHNVTAFDQLTVMLKQV